MSDIMRDHFFVFLFIVFVSVSCSSEKEPEINVQTIVLQASTDVLPISSFIRDLDYLELKASDGNITIGEIEDIKVLWGDIIIKQRKAREQSFIRFSKTGEFICEIVNNESHAFSSLKDIIEYQKGFAVLSEKGIHHFSKKGEYKGQLISDEITGGTFFEDGKNFLVINETPRVDFLSEYSRKSESAPPHEYNQRINKWIYTDLWQAKKNEYHLISSFNNTVYLYRNNKLIPRYKLDGASYPTLSDVWQNVGDRDEKETMRYIYDTQHVLVRNYLENDKRLFITYWVGSKSNTIIVNKTNWETRYYARAVNDIDGGIWEKPLYLSEDNELYIPISSYKISGHKIMNKWHKEFEQLQQKMANNENPVIMRCGLK